MEERLQFVEECKSQEWSMAEVCRRFQISRPTGYKWLARYDAEGLEGLRDRPHTPHHHHNQVAEEIEDGVVEARSQHPHWGPVKLRSFLQRTAAEVKWPAASTIGAILQRHGLTVAKKHRPKTPPNPEPMQNAERPNVVWCADFKGWFRCGDGTRCDALTITDQHSRFLLRCQSLKHADTFYTRPLFEAAFREYGLPQYIRTDNGTPFASLGIGGLSELSVWWIKLGIRPERIEPGKPTQNGRHERMHRTLKQQTAQPPRGNLREQQKAFDLFRHEYNHQRPHQALQGRTPAECYQCSPLPYCSRLVEVTYPEEYEIRYVSDGGQIRWGGAKLFVGRALVGETIGLEFLADGKWRVWFSFYDLGVFDERKMLIYPAAEKKSSS